ncbi:MAG TPA: peptide ABC transporter substrate-binding protein [Gemmatimonadaceae bacterium]|jgi:peptide/nickel transport system substrate-binding protein
MRTRFLALVVCGTLVGCGGREGPALGASTGGTVVIAVPSDAATIFPPHTFDQVGRAVQDQLYDRLADIGDDMNTIGDKGFTPRLAERWEWSRDSMSVAFHINPRARWHDGQPVRANDVRFSYRIFTDPKVGSNVTSEISTIDSVSIRDSLTAVVWFKQRRPEAFYDFVYQIYILPEHVLKDVPPDQLRTSDVTRKGIGSGRFRLARWDAGRRLEIVADTANYFGRAKLDRVIWSIVPDAGAALAQLLGGQADLLEVVPPDQVHLVDSSKADRPVPYPNLQYAFLGFNLVDPKNAARSHPIFGDRQVRRALSMALDRRAMLQNVFGSLGRLSFGPFPRSISFADTTLRLLPYDVNAAKSLLDSAGWRELSPGGVRQKNGMPLRFSLTLPVSSRPRVAYSVLIQEQLRRVGAQVDVEQLQSNAVGKKLFDRTYDAMLVGLSTDPSPSGYKQQWGSAGIPPAGQNYTGYTNPTYDALVDSAVATSDIAMQRAFMRRAFQLQIDDAPGIWLYDPPTIAGIERRVHAAAFRADNWEVHLADWTIPPNERIDRDRIGLGGATP